MSGGGHPVRELVEGRPSRAALEHLLGGCRECARMLARALAPPAEAAADVDVAGALHTALSAWDRGSVEGLAAPHLVRRLLRHPHGRRLTLVQSSWQYHLPKVVELLCDRSRRALSSSPSEAVALAELAAAAADRILTSTYGEALCLDLRGRARVFLGLARRKAADLLGAERELAEAERLLERGTRDPAERAWMLEVRGSLRTRQRRLDDALRDYRQALAAHRRAGNRHLLGRVYSRISRAWAEDEEPERAARVLALAAGAVDSGSDRRLAMALAHNLVEALLEMGERERALQVMREAVPAYEVFARPAERVTLRWTEARILARAGHLERADEAFRAARDGFLELELVIEGTLCCLEWALVQARRGRPDLVAQVAAEMAPIFESRQLARETMAALSLFRRAAEEGGATTRMIRAVARVVRSRRAAEG